MTDAVNADCRQNITIFGYGLKENVCDLAHKDVSIQFSVQFVRLL